MYNIIYRYRNACAAMTEIVTDIGFYPYEIAGNAFIYLSVFVFLFPVDRYRNVCVIVRSVREISNRRKEVVDEKTGEIVKTFGTLDGQSVAGGGRGWCFHRPLPLSALIDLIACRLNCSTSWKRISIRSDGHSRARLSRHFKIVFGIFGIE